MVVSRRILIYLVCLTIALAIGVQIALAFSDSLTNRAVQTGNSELDACRSVPKPDRFNCVGDALRRAARVIARKPDYSTAVGIIRQAADTVKRSKQLAVALTALSTAKKMLLRATGEARSHYAKLATLMDKAKSVLRS